MGLKNALQKKIDKKNMELEDLRRQKIEIEARILAVESYIEGVQDSMKSADKSINASNSGVTRAVKAGSSTDKAQKALRAIGRPAHISELLGLMGMEDTVDNQRNVSSSLSASYRNDRIFTRPQSKTFGLIEWNESQDNEDGAAPLDANAGRQQAHLNWQPSQWVEIISSLSVQGMPLQLARNSILVSADEDQVHLQIDPEYETLAAPRWKERLREKLSEYAQLEVQLKVEVPKNFTGSTPARAEKQAQKNKSQEVKSQLRSVN